MWETVKKIFGKKSTDYKMLVKNGAQIIDVRTEAEFSGGHLFSAMNIPLQNLSADPDRIDRSKPVIICCASGVRSAAAKDMLESKGFAEVYDGGAWKSLEKKLK